MKTTWAMVGTGLMLDLVGNDLQLTENVDARVIVSRTQERADAAATAFGFASATDDYDAVLERDDIDVVYIATPHALHFDQAMAALGAGKHVLVEKPMTMSADHTRRLCAFARDRGLFAMEAMWTAFNPAIVEMRRRVAAGDLGEVQSVHADFHIAPAVPEDHRLWAKHLGGGSTLDQGVYTLSLAHMLLGEPDSIDVTATIVRDVDADIVAQLGYSGGHNAICSNGLTNWSPCRASVNGTAACIEIPGQFWKPDGFVQLTPGPTGLSGVPFSYQREGGGYVPMLRAVSAAILNGQTEHPNRTHADSVAVATMMDEVLRQAFTA